eukprot:8891915-Pyramimonas_sp.AAC.1
MLYTMRGMCVYGLPSCDWFSRWVYTVSPPVIGSHAGYIPPPLLRLVLTLGINCLPSCDWFSRRANWESIAEPHGGKMKCKLALQRQLGLPERPEVPLLAFIGRLDQQKGVDQ